MEIRQQIVEGQIEKVNDHLGLNDPDKAFQIFGHTLFCDQSLHSFDSNDDVDGGQDKQIDCITIEENQGEGVIYITQIKNEESFSSNTIIKIRNGLHWVFKKKRADIDSLANIKFKDKINECKSLISLIGPSNIEVKVGYICNGMTDSLSDECNQEIKTILDEFDNDVFSSFSFETIGAIEIVDLINSQEKKNRRINADIKIKYDTNSPSLIKYHSHGLKGIICTTSAKEIAQIVNTDSKGFVFDLNIRKYLGNRGAVNRDIKETCSDEDSSYLFWFLNNGVTIVCDKVDPVTDPDDPHIKVENLQIVNGCQTSTSLAIAEKEGILQDDVKIILKVFETTDLGLVDKVVLTTNNQNKITNRNLRANDRIQRDLERAFEIYNYYYERKPRQFLNKPANRIIPNEDVATSFLAIALKRPSDARSRKYKIWSNYYDTIFKTKNVEAFILAFLIKEAAQSYLKSSGLYDDPSEFRRYVAKNAHFHIARIASFIWRRTDNWGNVDSLKSKLEEIENDPSLLDQTLEESYEKVLDLINADPRLKVDLNSTLKSSSFDNQISRMVHREYGTQQSA